MKIIKIEVKKLFGVFNHEIPLNTKDHITIIHGPNGYGKTILLTLVNAIFDSQYSIIASIPFSELLIYFDNKSKLCLKKGISSEKDDGKKEKNGEQLLIELSNSRSKQKVYIPKMDMGLQDLPFPPEILEEIISGLERVSQKTWLYLPTHEKLSINQVLDRFGHMLPFSKIKKIAGPAWLRNIINSININFIDTQRLLNVSHSTNDSIIRESIIRIRRSPIPVMTPAVITYSEELAKAIQTKLAEYGSLSQALDRTFPTRLVKGKRSDHHTIDKLKIELNALEEKRSRLIAAGFLEKGKEIDFKDLQKIDESNINVLSVYIKDVKQKLSVFDELTEKIDLLIKIINIRFLHKKLSINKTDGFVFKTSEGKIIPPTSLSSGEQHELVLLYEMLFKVKPNSLILIDEPEISLHVAWQQEFLKDLQEITRLVGFDVLIATHSPQIINDRWDLTVELKGPKQ
ncbi:MAG: AAA family ATPase [Candidatus Aminicenantes bacterium]|nr:MAG: AAA family ATPase [Candidatus Aminicenantes bacterium]